ncbi:MAG TPA: hypothetical protein VEW69_13340 [Alphaproteobacteria bacterium]|nr:hypothetical protein [Alphaproteobacteria bacterium]
MFKKILSIVLLTLVVVTQAMAQQADTVVPPVQKPTTGVVRVPRRAGLKFATMQPLDSATAQVGDEVPLRLARALVVNDVVVLPVGEVVHAKVTKVKKAHACHNGEVDFKLDHITFPDASTARTRVWAVDPNPDAEVASRLRNEWGGEGSLPPVNDWWDVVLNAPMYAFVAVCYAPLVAIMLPLVPFSLDGISFDGNKCTTPGKEFELPANSTVAVMVARSHRVHY